MGADLYNYRVAERNPETRAAQVKMTAMQDAGVTDANRNEYRAAHDCLWHHPHAAYSDPLYYFRDSYNNSSLLWQLGLSWWTDVIPLETHYTDAEHDAFEKNDSWPKCNMTAEACQTFLDLIESKAPDFAVAMAELEVSEGQDIAEAREYFIDKHKKLVEFLRQGILDGGISASL